MFCYLEQVELRTPKCPITNCLYRNTVGDCAYESLTDVTDVTAQTIAEAKGIKLYRAKSEIADGRSRIEIGLMIDKYAEWVCTVQQEDVSAQLVRLKTKNEIEAVLFTGADLKGNPVNKEEDTLIEVILLTHFKLGKLQRAIFFDPVHFAKWQSGSKVTVSLEKFIEVLKATVA